MMSTKAVGRSRPRVRRARHALTALTLIGASTACDSGQNTVVGPPTPGSITVTTETSGFLKDDSFELLLDGESQGTVGANDEMTISELEPATYELALGDVAENCEVATVAAQVTSANTATASLTVVCAPPAPTPYTIRASRDRPNLDDGTITECTFGICPSDTEWDMWAYFYSSGEAQAEVRQNQATAVEIAHLTGVTLDNLTEADFDGASFTTDLVNETFDSGRVILIRTDLGAVYALGNPVEDGILLTLTFDAVQLVAP